MAADDRHFAAIRELWERGWQPADVVRGARRIDARAEGPVIDAIVVDAERYLPDGCDERWARQVTDAAARRAQVGDSDDAAAEQVLRLLRLFPPMAQLHDPPGGSGRRAAAGPADDGMVNRVKALLAKAESTTFPEEAEALVAKAQELMARHSIDQAVLAASRPKGSQPAAGGRRIQIDEPYVGPKALLLAGIAKANRCRAVWSSQGGYADVFGHDEDLDAVELLFLSLLVFATGSLARLGKGGDAQFRSRTYRRSFLVAFASRISERLAEATRTVEAAAAATHGERLLPALRAREVAVQDALQRAHPNTRPSRFVVRDAAGWAAGRAAADQADLGARSALGR
jgi:hypothetical protein